MTIPDDEIQAAFEAETRTRSLPVAGGGIARPFPRGSSEEYTAWTWFRLGWLAGKAGG